MRRPPTAEVGGTVPSAGSASRQGSPGSTGTRVRPSGGHRGRLRPSSPLPDLHRRLSLAPPPPSSAWTPGAGSPSGTGTAAGCPAPVRGGQPGVASGAGRSLGLRALLSPVAGTAARAAASSAGMGAPRTGSLPAGVSPRRARLASADGGLLAVPFLDRGSERFHGCEISRRALGVPANPGRNGFPAGRSRRRLAPCEFPVQRADEPADQPRVAAEVPQPPGARSRTEIHPRLRLRVEFDADHHVARAAGKAPPRQGLDHAFLLVPPAGMPARQFTANEVEGGLPYLSEGNGIGAAHETPIGGVGRRSGSSRHKRALETTGKREFLAQPVPPWRPGWRNRGNSQRLILRRSASEFHSAG